MPATNLVSAKSAGGAAAAPRASSASKVKREPQLNGAGKAATKKPRKSSSKLSAKQPVTPAPEKQPTPGSVAELLPSLTPIGIVSVSPVLAGSKTYAEVMTLLVAVCFFACFALCAYVRVGLLFLLLMLCSCDANR